MTSANRLWQVQVGLGLLGFVTALGALLVAATRVELAVPSIADLLAACQRWALPGLRPSSVLVLAVGGVGFAALALTVRSAVRQVRASRALATELRRSPPLGGVKRGYVFEATEPHAFCAGLLRPRVYLSRGALESLTADERAAVLTHEVHHARRRDPLRLLLARSLADGLFFLPAMRRLSQRYAAAVELSADEAAVQASGREALASALVSFDAHPSAAATGIAPERVDNLLGKRSGWELPTLLVLGSVATAGAVVAVTVRLADATAQGSVGIPALAAQACMLVMAVAPLLLCAAGLIGGARLIRRRNAD